MPFKTGSSNVNPDKAGRMEPNPPEGPPRTPTAQGHRNGPCSECGAEIGENCRCKATGQFMSGVHEPRRKRTERTGMALLSRKEASKLGFKKGYSSSPSDQGSTSSKRGKKKPG